MSGYNPEKLAELLAAIPPCPICGGNAGRYPAEGHYICQEFRKRNLPVTPMYRCPECLGTQTSRKGDLPAGVLLPMMPTGRELELWFPKCKHCGGKGYVTCK